MSDLHACAAKQVVSSPWGAPLLGSPSPFAESHAKDAPRQIPSKFRTSPVLGGHASPGTRVSKKQGQRTSYEADNRFQLRQVRGYGRPAGVCLSSVRML